MPPCNKLWVTELQRRFRSVFDEVARNRTPIVLTRGSRPEAALIPYEDYLRFQQMQENEVLTRFDRVWDRLAEVNAVYSDNEIAADIQAARPAQPLGLGKSGRSKNCRQGRSASPPSPRAASLRKVRRDIRECPPAEVLRIGARLEMGCGCFLVIGKIL